MHEDHSQTPHVYVVYWPHLAVIKVGISTGPARWQGWERRRAALIATRDCCCLSHARAIEQWMLRRIAARFPPAFDSEEDARIALGYKLGGYTECYRLKATTPRNRPPDDPWDYEAAYGLVIPHETRDDLEHYHFAFQPIDGLTLDGQPTTTRCTHTTETP